MVDRKEQGASCRETSGVVVTAPSTLTEFEAWGIARKFSGDAIQLLGERSVAVVSGHRRLRELITPRGKQQGIVVVASPKSC